MKHERFILSTEGKLELAKELFHIREGQHLDFKIYSLITYRNWIIAAYVIFRKNRNEREW